MNFDIASIQPMLNGSAQNSDGLAADSAPQGLFAGLLNTALGEQLAILQQQQVQGMPLPEALQGTVLADLQNFALQNGVTLPVLDSRLEGEIEDIDLQETFQVLADILSTIDSASVSTVDELDRQLALEISVHTESVAEFIDPQVQQQAQGMAALLTEQGELSKQSVALSSMDGAEQEKKASLASVLPSSTKTETLQAVEQEEKVGHIQDTLETDVSFSEHTESDEHSADFWAHQQSADQIVEQSVDDTGKQIFRSVADVALNERMPTRANSAELAPMNSRMADPDWGNELAQRLVFMHKQSIPAAQLNLNPKHLGPVSIRVDVDNDKTSIAFSVQHGVVKDAIEAALPKLKEMLGGQQLNLVDVNVSQQQSEQKSSSPFMMSSDGQQREQQDEPQQQRAQAEQEMSVLDEIEAGRAIAKQGVLSIFA